MQSRYWAARCILGEAARQSRSRRSQVSMATWRASYDALALCASGLLQHIREEERSDASAPGDFRAPPSQPVRSSLRAAGVRAYTRTDREKVDVMRVRFPCPCTCVRACAKSTKELVPAVLIQNTAEARMTSMIYHTQATCFPPQKEGHLKGHICSGIATISQP